MREKVVIFDGKDLHTIGAEYFFQHEVIRDLKKEEVLHIYQHTMFCNYTAEHDDESRAKMTKGSNILEQMVLDMYGKTEGQLHIDRVNYMMQ